MNQHQEDEDEVEDVDEPPPKKRKSNDDSNAVRPSVTEEPSETNAEASKKARSSVAVLPLELQSVDFSKRVSWGKYHPYADANSMLPLTPIDTEPSFTAASPALCHHVNALSGRARACTIHLKPQKGQPSKTSPVPTPMFMPVGTKGCLKGLTFHELTQDPALQCPIILANTYHLAIQPGTELIDEMNGLHAFQGLPNITNNGESSSSAKTLPYNLLTDSGGFQMVSLVKLSKVTEEGVSFENPYKQQQQCNDASKRRPDLSEKPAIDGDVMNDDDGIPRGGGGGEEEGDDRDMLLLRPEDSIRHQNKISANIIMALDDVVSSVAVDAGRFAAATHRTLRWYDRCYAAHGKRESQSLFPIVQGGLDAGLGGLREQCLAGFRHRELDLRYVTPGYSIGGLAGGEEKAAFWRVVDQCCRALPDDKPRYLMGVGYPLDLVVCTALGVDMYDCVYPTRTARFGVALVPGKAPGTLRLKGNDCATADFVMQSDCKCQACRESISRSRLHMLFKAGNPVAVELITQHNLAYMMSLVRSMRQAIVENRFAEYATQFVREQYPGKEAGGQEVPSWVVDALAAAGIRLLPESSSTTSPS